MRFHHFKFFRGELARLAQNGVINSDFADVVHRRGRNDAVAKIIIYPQTFIFLHLFDKYLHNIAGSLDVTAGGIVPAFNHRQHPDDKFLLQIRNVLILDFHIFFEGILIFFHREKVAHEAADRNGKHAQHCEKAIGVCRIQSAG